MRRKRALVAFAVMVLTLFLIFDFSLDKYVVIYNPLLSEKSFDRVASIVFADLRFLDIHAVYLGGNNGDSYRVCFGGCPNIGDRAEIYKLSWNLKLNYDFRGFVWYIF